MGKTSGKARRARTGAAADLVNVGGSEKMFQLFVPVARKLDKHEVVPLRADVLLAATNVTTGVAAVMAHKDEVRAGLPKTDLKLLASLPQLAQAVIFANTQIDYAPGSTGRTAALLKRARVVRGLMLDSAKALASAKVLLAREVKRIAAGSGNFDVATDCVALAALFRKRAAKVKGKTAVTAEHIAEADEVGSELLKVLKPKGARRSRKASGDAAVAMELRDRLWSLLVQGHRELRRAGMWLWVEEVDEHVPPLLAFRQVSKKAAAVAKKTRAKGEKATPVPTASA